MLQLLALLGAIALAPLVSADLCRGYYGYYDCNNGLSIGARIGIGVGIAAAVIALIAGCSYWRRKQLRNQFSKYRPPVLPINNGGSYQQNNPYANNPPPPPTQPGSYYNQSSNWSNNQFGQNPSTPANVYQPSLAGAYGNRDVTSPVPKENGTNGDHEHGYEWAQAREAERLEREQSGAGAPPPGYEVSSNPTGSTTYSPPSGPPPKNVVS